MLTYFKTRDGLELPALLFRESSKSQTELGAVIVHGKGGSFFEKHLTSLASHLSQQGIASLTFNNRGAGEAGHARELFNDCAHDIAGAVRELKERSGCQYVLLAGHSYGGLKAAYYAAEEEPPAALVLMSAIPQLKLSLELVSTAVALTTEGGGAMLFSRLEGSEHQLYQPEAILSNSNTGYQGTLYDLVSRLCCPILSFASQTEWDWFHEVPLEIHEYTRANKGVRACLLPDIGDHCYTGYEDKVADFVAAWCSNLSDIHISKSTA